MKLYLTVPPPSLNHAFRNLPGKGRVKSSDYKKWSQDAWYELLSQKPGKFKERVDVFIRLPEKTVQGDSDNRIKPVLDLLVEMKVLTDDRKQYVRFSGAGFFAVTCTEVVITPCETPWQKMLALFAMIFGGPEAEAA